jgi:hypothetical protein
MAPPLRGRLVASSAGIGWSPSHRGGRAADLSLPRAVEDDSSKVGRGHHGFVVRLRANRTGHGSRTQVDGTIADESTR